MRVLKFGGSSVASAARLGAVAGIVSPAARQSEVVVVVSALGGVTDALLRLVDTAGGGHTWEGGALAVSHRHLDCLRELGGGPLDEAALRGILRELSDTLAAIAESRSATPAARDAALSAGERLAVHLAALALRRAGLDAVTVDARDLVVTDSSFGEATPDLVATARATRARLGVLPLDRIAVVTGFIGADPQGRTTTLGRGGSDYTASILGAVLAAEAVEIWSDVSGVLAASPREVPHAATLSALTYREATALACFGAKVLYPKTMDPLARSGIPILVRNTFAPSGPHTVVGGDAGLQTARPRAITSLDGGVLVTLDAGPVDGGGAFAEVQARLRAAGGALRPCRPTASTGNAVLVTGIPAGEIRSVWPAAAWDRPAHRVRDGVGVVAVVGEGVGGNELALMRARQALAAARIPVLAEVATGTPAALALVVQRGHLREAVWVLHEALLGPRAESESQTAAGPAAAGR